MLYVGQGPGGHARRTNRLTEADQEMIDRIKIPFKHRPSANVGPVRTLRQSSSGLGYLHAHLQLGHTRLFPPRKRSRQPSHAGLFAMHTDPSIMALTQTTAGPNATPAPSGQQVAPGYLVGGQTLASAAVAGLPELQTHFNSNDFGADQDAAELGAQRFTNQIASASVADG